MPELQTVWITTRSPHGEGDPGAVEPGHYSVSGDMLTMHDENGRPLGKTKLSPDDDAHVVAGRLTRERWLKTTGASDFHRKLNYQNYGVA
jgi:hypothetical protein